ncbi:hypothetical protein JUN65_12730 [Gluconacetobacter azotocaptans]|uniref:methyl-accepting chemotaxis protein n=1 Tax=Gluconacetobacter azotocaptans TaxID=142834 RepID=UPI00195ADE1B|nr:methyl-accepting chemotaxis protein [Gluconacetobacter azotocaptans]MBM9402447.1 hypothetical protein [Gluconacetobacter azotocaptans]
MEAIKRGDLEVSLDKPFAADYESIRKDFNAGLYGIKELISQSHEEINKGVKFVNDTGSCIKETTKYIGELGDLIEDVSISSQEQSRGLNEINSAMNEMDVITQKNAAMVEETTAAVHNLEREATSLRQIVNHFKIDHDYPALTA